MTVKYFRALADAKWSNDLNWSLSSGGGNDTTKAVAGDDVIVEATLHVDTVEACLSFINSGNYSYTFDSTLDVSTDFEINSIGALQGTGTVTIQGDFAFTEKASNSNTIQFTLNGTLDQGIDFSGTSQGGSGIQLVINKVSGVVSPTVDMFQPPSGEADLTLTAGVFDALTFKCYFDKVFINGGTYNGGSALNSIDGTFEINGGIFNATTDVMSLNGSIANAWNKTAGTFNHMNGQVDFISTSQYQECRNVGVTVFYKLRIAKNVYDFDVLTTKIQVADRLIIDNDVSSKSPEFSGTIEMTGTATMEQNGNLYGGGVIKFIGTNHIWLQNNINVNAQVPPITVDCTDLTLTPSVSTNNFGIPTLTWLSGTITNAELYNFRNNKQFTHMVWDLFAPLTVASMQWDSGNFDFNIADQNLIILGDYDVTGISSGSQFTGGTIEVQGDYTQTSSGGASQSLGNLIFNGTVDQNIFIDGGGVGRLLCTSATVNKASGKLIFLSDVEIGWGASDFIQTAGELDLNGFDLTTGNDLTINAAVSDLAGSTITVLGNFAATFTSLTGTAPWFLTVTGTSQIIRGTLLDCDASGGTALQAIGTNNSGGNINVVFSVGQTVWDQSSGNLASTNANWTLGVPDDLMGALYDATSLAVCTWDVTTCANIEVAVAYTGVVTQASDLTLDGAFTQNGGVASDWLTSGFDLVTGDDATIGPNSGFVASTGTILTVIGDWLTDAAAVIDLQSGSTFRLSGDLNIPSPNSHPYRGLVIAGYGGTAFAFSNADNSSRIDQMQLSTGCVMTAASNCYVDDMIGPTDGVATIEGAGLFIVITNWQNQFDCVTGLGTVINADVDGGIEITYGTAILPSGDYGNATISTANNAGVTIQGTCPFICYDLDNFQISQNKTTPCNIIGSIDATITNRLKISDIVTRGGDFTWDSSGTLTINELEVNAIDGIQSSIFTATANAGDIVMAGPFSLGALAEIDLSAFVKSLFVGGNIDIDATSVVAPAGAPITLFGASAQVINGNNNQINRMINCKSGGSTTFNTEMDMADGYFSRPEGHTSTVFLVGVAHDIAYFDFNNLSAFKETLDSSDGVTPVVINNTSVGPIGRTTDVGRITLALGTQDMDDNTCSDLGGNTNFNFADLPIPTQGSSGEPLSNLIGREIAKEIAR